MARGFVYDTQQDGTLGDFAYTFCEFEFLPAL